MSDKHEYCKGYLDSYGHWNNGFYCHKWGGPNEMYCCGSSSNRYCCEEPSKVDFTTATPLTTAAVVPAAEEDAIPIVPIMIAASTGFFVIIVIVVLACFFCRCCPGYPRCNKQAEEENKQNEAVAAMEEASHATIPLPQPQPHPLYPYQTNIPITPTHPPMITALPHHQSHASLALTATTDNSGDSHHHCGCHAFSPAATLGRHRQSPNPITHSPAAEALEKLKFSLYENPIASFQKEEEAHIGRDSPIIPLEKYPKPVPLPDPANFHISPDNTAKRRSAENPFGRTLCLETFRTTPRSPSPLAPMPPIHFHTDPYRPDSGVLMEDIDIETLVNLARKHERYSNSNTYTGTR